MARTPEEFSNEVVKLTTAVASAKETKNTDEENLFQTQLEKMISNCTDSKNLNEALRQLNSQSEDVNSKSREFLETSQQVLVSLYDKMIALNKAQNEKPAASTLIGAIQAVGKLLKSNPDEKKAESLAQHGSQLLQSINSNALDQKELGQVQNAIKETVNPLKKLMEKFKPGSSASNSLNKFFDNAKALMAKIGNAIVPDAIRNAVAEAKNAKNADTTKQRIEENQQKRL